MAVTPWIFPDDIVLTSDVDILQLNRSLYDEVNGTGEIFILNADCCGRFTWVDGRISMQPMTSIGTTLRNWKRLMEIRRLVWETAVHLAVACDVFYGVFCAVIFPAGCLGWDLGLN